MSGKYGFIGAALLATFIVLPAHAVDEFYIVRDQGTNECRVVQERPTNMREVVVTDTAYSSEENAIGALRTVCGKH